MSVMMLDVELYEVVLQKIKTYKDLTIVNIHFSHWGKQLNDYEAREFVERLCILNELTYDAGYNQDKQEVPDIYKFIEDKYRAPINTYQMLSHLKCIKYQIEPDTIKQSKNYTWPEWGDEVMILLGKLIEELMTRIIESLPQWESVKWGSID